MTLKLENIQSNLEKIAQVLISKDMHCTPNYVPLIIKVF